MRLFKADLTGSGRPILASDEFERCILDKVDLDLPPGSPDYVPDKFKGGDVILTTQRVIWRGGPSQLGAAWGLPVSAVRRVRRESTFSFRTNVKLEITVGVDTSGRPVEGGPGTEKLTLKCKGDSPDSLKENLENLVATRPWAQAPTRPPAAAAAPQLTQPSSSASGAPPPPPAIVQSNPLGAGRPQYQATGYQSTAGGLTPVPAAPDPNLVRQLQDMGFGKNRSARAVLATQNQGLQPALDYLLAFSNQPGMDDPLPPPPRPTATPTPVQTPQYPPVRSDPPPPPPSVVPWSSQPPPSSSWSGGYPQAPQPQPIQGGYGYPPQHYPVTHNPLLEAQQPGPYGTARYTAIPASSSTPVPSGNLGVAGLLKRQEQKTAESARSLESAFQDLGALMTMAQQMVALAERFRGVITGPPSGDGSEGGDLVDLATQQELIALGITSPVTRESAGARFHQELARQLADFLMGSSGAGQAGGPLARNGGMLPLPDIYCLFNRARGSELVSPDDLLQAAQLFPSLRIPLTMRRFSSGLLVLQSATHTDSQVAARIAALSSPPPPDQDTPPAGYVPGLGVPLTASDVAKAMGVPLVIAGEHLSTAEQLGAVCRDDGPEGLRYFRNFFVDTSLLVV